MSKDVVLLDGGMGQEIVKRFAQKATPMWSTQIMLDHPELVQSVHEDYIRAGARIITLNNYTATRERLHRDATVDLMKPIHETAKSIASAARSAVGDKNVRIAGSLPPLVATYKSEFVPSFDHCLGSYRELVALQQDGVDLFMVETASTIHEARAAATAAIEAGFTVCVSFTIDDNATAKLRSGEDLPSAIKEIEALGAAAIAVNCSMPETITRSLPILSTATIPTGAYANGFTSIDGLDAGGTVDSLEARDDFGAQAYANWGLACVENGLKIIGGCCETDPSHIAALSNSLLAQGYEIVSNF